MNKIVLAASIAIAQLLAVNAIAQTKGEADPAQSKAIPSAPATKAEKAAAKSERKAAGKEVAKSSQGAGAAAYEANKTKSMAKATSKDQKVSAKAKRKAEGAEVAKDAGKSPEAEGNKSMGAKK